MSISWLLTNLVVAFLLPPLNGLLLAGVGWLLWQRRPRLARTLVAVGLALLIILALPVVGNAMQRSLEGIPVSAAQVREAQAIVVLGGGRYRDALEYGGDTVAEATLLRLRYAAKLQRESGLPLLVTGGKPDGGDLSEAEAMRRTLTAEFGVPVRWVEGASDNTHENALYSARLLKPDGITRVLLVTHAWHMPRALRSFAAEGLAVAPAPTFFHRKPLTPLDFLPQGYSGARHAIHEWIGLFWYRMRG
ncbi:MAG: YdcF family protein [Gammaproteobacteria bacterium]|nr:YdcF family protein [Gammaproteobacteria bacterium]MBU1645922.1 YdcF family protein [Gammaproteobacteria bacterium]MBU1971984.1 YdcF family protein [Gammaproteobacteria bacterium]